MSSPSKMLKLDPTADEQETTEAATPILPDDVLRMVFGELSHEERAPLGTTCKHIRELDFEVGKKAFVSIDFKWNDQVKKITVKDLTSKYVLNEKDSSSIHNNYQVQRLLRNAETDLLSIKHTALCNLTDFHIHTNLINKTQFKKCKATFNCMQSFPESRIFTLFEGQNLKNSQVSLTIFSTGPSNNKRKRESVFRIPEIDEFRLKWSRGRYYNGKIDDATLVNIVANAKHAEFDTISLVCTAQGILDAFELVCQSEGYKYAEFSVPRSSIFDLFEMSTPRFEKIEYKYIFDRTRNSVLIARWSLLGSCIRMGKLDDDGELQCRSVKWA